MRFHYTHHDGPSLLLTAEEIRRLRKESAVGTLLVNNSAGEHVPRSVRIFVYPHDAVTLAKVETFPEGTSMRNASHYDISISNGSLQNFGSLGAGRVAVHFDNTMPELFLMQEEQKRYCGEQKAL